MRTVLIIAPMNLCRWRLQHVGICFEAHGQGPFWMGVIWEDSKGGKVHNYGKREKEVQVFVTTPLSSDKSKILPNAMK